MTPKPRAIRGPEAFGPEDGELFVRLGREEVLNHLRSHILDDQIPVIALQGTSGVGKTSILRSGLPYFLRDDPTTFIYWEATRSDPSDGLLNAMSRQAAIKLSQLTDLLNLEERRFVVLIDQMEQLSPTEHPGIFNFIQTALASPTPYKTTILVSFRNEYSSDWLHWESENVHEQFHRIRIVSLANFRIDQAMEAVETLLEAASLDIDRGTVRQLLEDTAEKGRVTGVDIGITLLALSELPGNGSNKSNLAASTGQAGLLRLYIETKLDELFPPDIHESIIKMMMALIDPDDERIRIAHGVSASTLAKNAPSLTVGQAKTCLRRLASPNVRLLEKLTESISQDPVYRLPHEKFIPALRKLVPALFSESSQAQDSMDRLHRQWSAHRESRYLLRGSELRQVLQHMEILHWGGEESEKRNFILQSVRQRDRQRRILGVALIVIVGFLALGVNQYLTRSYMVGLTRWGLPGDLYQRQSQLEGLYFNAPVTDLDWLRSGVRDLHIGNTSLNTLDFAENPAYREVKTLTVSGNNALVAIKNVSTLSNLESLVISGHNKLTQPQIKGPSKLQHLTFTNNPGTTDISDLASLEYLETLTISWGSAEASTPDLSTLVRLKSLEMTDLVDPTPNLSKLSSLENLKISWHFSPPAVPDFSMLSNLRSLTLSGVTQSNVSLSIPKGIESLKISFYSGPVIIPDYSNLEKLKSLTISIVNGLTDLPDFSRLPGLESLEISGITPATHFPDLSGLSNLSSLTLSGGAWPGTLDTKPDISMLPNLAGLSNLKSLSISGYNGQTKLPDLSTLSNLRSLEIVGTYSLSDFSSLGDLTSLQSLAIYNNYAMTNLPDLSALQGLGVLIIHGNNKLTELPELSGLSNLRSLKIASNFSLESLPDLAVLPNLELLELTWNKSLPALPDFGKLRSLRALNISNVRGSAPRLDLRGLEALEALRLDDIELKDLSFVPANVTYLFLSTGQLGTIDGLKYLPASVRYLGFSSSEKFSEFVQEIESIDSGTR